MKIVIENVTFPYDIGCKILKSKYEDKCPLPELKEIWNDIVPINFKEIAKLNNLEQRRIGVNCLGIENLIREVQPKKLKTETLVKKTTWVTDNGELEIKTFKDTYELYEVTANKLGLTNFDSDKTCFYYVKCKDTSTDREYMIWIEPQSVFFTNNKSDRNVSDYGRNITPIQAIAWTIQTDIKTEDISEIKRQGDCILIKKKDKEITHLNTLRHLTEKEYKKLLVSES